MRQCAGPYGAAMTHDTHTPAPPFEPRWPSVVAIGVAIALYVSLPDTVISDSHGSGAIRFVVPVLELALLIPLAVAAPHRHVYESGKRRMAAITLTAIVSLANIASLGFLVHELLYSGATLHGRQLLSAAGQIWWTNVIVFGLWYWELDGGGPPSGRQSRPRPRLAFPQMTDPGVAQPGWHPRFVDYFYVSFTNASAFSPTDTMPLTRWAKLLMLTQSTVSILTLILVAARAVNILR